MRILRCAVPNSATLPRERGKHLAAFTPCQPHRIAEARSHGTSADVVAPSPSGEGWGEGKGTARNPTALYIKIVSPCLSHWNKDRHSTENSEEPPKISQVFEIS